MRVCLWHGWLLAGTGSNVFAAKKAESLRALGHDVVLLCQEPHPERYAFVDAWATVDARGVAPLTELGRPPSPGRVVALRPAIGELLPVFVLDEYEGFEAKRFVDLTDDELGGYLDANVAAFRAAVAWHRSDLVVAGHVIPGPVLARRAVGPGRYAVHVHGSDLEYAIDVQERYAALARPALEGAIAVLGSSADVLGRAAALAPSISSRTARIPPGVDVDRFRPRSRADGLAEAAETLDRARRSGGAGRAASMDGLTAQALAARDGAALDALALAYDQRAPDRDAAMQLRELATFDGPIVGYLGKLIPPKGVEIFLQALALHPSAVGLVLGFGGAREWYAALVAALDRGDAASAAWLADAGGLRLELGPEEIERAAGLAARVRFTGIVDHAVAPLALAGVDVLVVPSIGKEAFGMVAAEAAAAGAIPLVARHSGLAEVAAALEDAAGRPDLLSFEPGPGAVARCARGLDALLSLSGAERRAIRDSIERHVRETWTWTRTVERMLDACGAAAPHAGGAAASRVPSGKEGGRATRRG
jgi:glycosyltransferase involved in cell wall biosynthesis